MTSAMVCYLDTLNAKLDAVIVELECPKCKGHGWVFQAAYTLYGEQSVSKIERCGCQDRIKKMVWDINP